MTLLTVLILLSQPALEQFTHVEGFTDLEAVTTPSGFGLLLIVDHGDGYMTLYGHNQSLFKEVGDWVEVNEPIALVGSSGGREQAGVYFGIRHQGRAVNPARWCQRPTGGKVG